MKKNIYFLFLAFGLLAHSTQAQKALATTVSRQSQASEIKLVSSNIDNTVLSFTLNDYTFKEVTTASGTKQVISSKNGVPMQQATAPDLLKYFSSVIVPDNAEMTTEVLSSSYTDYPDLDIAPSKGNLLRTVDPATVPYEYGPAYTTDAFYPGKLSDLGDPYIIRDFRGQSVNFYPFQYNPVTKVLRVYNSLTVKVKTTGNTGTNVFNRTKQLSAIDEEYGKIYDNHFINYKKSPLYTPLDEHGKMLVICYGQFMGAMQPFVDWKNTIGIPTVMVDVTTIGSTAAAIQTYVANYYNTNGLTFLLLVGDNAQIPTLQLSSGPSDNGFGYITGGDSYQEIIVGRFSAESVADVQTQVKRSIRYEEFPTMTPGLFNRCIGIGSDQGPGDNNEMDFEHERAIQLKLLGFTYTSNAELFDGSQGGLDASGNPVPANVTTEVNNGAGIITYTGHGAQDAWGTTAFSNANMPSLTDTTILPFIWSVACVNGEFDNGTCFAEGWMRANNNGHPSGAIATLMSTINQSWNPPMYGQDEMVNILTESYSSNIKRTFGGISVNGLFGMNDAYSDFAMTDTWTCFGDPSLMVRTADPMTMSVTHQSTINVGATQMVVNCNVDGALIALTINHQIIGTGYVIGGSANITFNQLTQIDTITVAATKFNSKPYIGSVFIVNSVQNDATPLIILDPQSNYNCLGSAVVPKIVIENAGINNLTSVNVSCQYDGGTAVSQQWTGTLASFQSDTMSFPAVTLTLGNHTIQFTTSLPNGGTDGNTSNDATIRNISVQNLPVTSSFVADETQFCSAPADVQFTNQSTNAQSYTWDFGDGSTSSNQNPTHTFTNLGAYTISLVADAGVCGAVASTQTAYIIVGATPPTVTSATLCGPGTANLQANGQGTLTWYDAATGGNIVNSGSSYSPAVSATTTYYVQDSISSPAQYVGNVNDTANGGMFTSSAAHYLIFDCYSAVTLESVEVNAGAAGSRTISLEDASGAVLQSATVNIPAGVSRIVLNFNIPVGTNLRLAGPLSPNLFRSNAGCAYPYNLAGLISITSSSASTNPTAYYYYFYDWKIQGSACVSAMVPVTAFVNNNQPDANFSYHATGLTVDFTDLSINPATYLWNFGDGTSGTDANPSHTYNVGGTYDVMLIVTNGCGVDTIIQQVSTSANSINNYSLESDFRVYPNPSIDGTVFVSGTEDGTLSVYNTNGKLINMISLKKGKTLINSSPLNAGMYYFIFRNDITVITKKIIVTGK